MLKINELSRLYLGVKGENESRTIEIDMSAWAQIYPNAVAVVLHKRNGDQAKELTGATYDSETKVLSWITTEYDTFYDGFGVAEIRMVENDVVKKTKDMITTVTASSITNGSGNVIESDYQAFLNAVIANKTAAQTAQTAAETAQGKAEDAQAAAEAAVENGPYIDSTTGNWFVYDWDDEEYKNTGVHAQGPAGADGSNGQDGQDGADGFSPTASVTKSGKVATITITDKNGTTTETVSDGEDADPTTIIDDTAGDGATNKVWSADKSYDEKTTLLNSISGKYSKPSGGIPGSDLADSYIKEPTNEGTSGQVLATDGNGGRAWSSIPTVTVDSALSTSSTNPLQNKVVANALKGLENTDFDIGSLIGQTTLSNKQVTGTGSYQAVIKMDLYANTLYSINLKLKSASTKTVYYRMCQSDGSTVIGYGDSISAGNTYAYKAITPSSDCIGAEFQVSSSADFEIEYANIFSNNSLMKQIGRTIIGDDITMLSVTSSNKKTISGTGTISTETDSTMYVTDEIEIKQNHWYMVTGSAGYAASYYAIYDADHNCMMVERSPSGSGTTCINRMVYTPKNSKYIRVAFITSISGGYIAECNTIKTKKYEAPEWWGKFLAISYSDIGIAHTNSLETFISAGHFGFPVCKGDVRPTSDGKLIMCHDGGFTFDGNGRITTYDSSNKTLIHNITYATAMTYEYAGQNAASENNHYQKVADIDGYLQVCKKYGMIAFITVREDYISTVCPEVIAALKRNNMLDRAIINSYTPAALTYLRMLDDNLPLSYVQSDNYNLGAARVNAVAGYGNAAITLVSTPANMRTYLTGIATNIALANTKGVGIMYAQPQTAEDVLWLREHGIMGAQIGRPCLPYQFSQIRFKISIASGTASLAEWFNMTTMSATVSQSSNTISVSEFKEAGSTHDFADLIMEYWMNKFPYRITATSEGGHSVTAAWQNNAIKLTVSDISVNDTIDVMIEV